MNLVERVVGLGAALGGGRLVGGGLSVAVHEARLARESRMREAHLQRRAS
jgi:hypothetical protein